MTVEIADVVDYMGPGASRYLVETTYPQIADALQAETANQSARVTFPTDYDDNPLPVPDLDQALKRRVVRNLAMRELPTAMLQGDAQVGPVRIVGQDPEVRRLEAPYRTWVIA